METFLYDRVPSQDPTRLTLRMYHLKSPCLDGQSAIMMFKKEDLFLVECLSSIKKLGLFVKRMGTDGKMRIQLEKLFYSGSST